MSRLRAVFLALAGALIVSTPGSAAGGLAVSGLDLSDYPRVRVSVVTPAPSAQPPRLTANGVPAVGVSAQNLGEAKSVVIAIDRSQSMEGQAFLDAVGAASDFIAAKPAPDRVGLVAYGSKAVALTGLSSATIDADTTLRTMETDATPGTALFDAVVTASNMLSAERLPGRVIVLLTDGKDVSSKADLATAVRKARFAGAAVYSIGIASHDFDSRALEQLATATGGHYYEAGKSAVLTQIYASIAEELKRTWRMSYLTPLRPGRHLELVATVPGAGSARAEATVPGTVASTGGKGVSLVPDAFYENHTGGLALALLVGFCVLAAVALALAVPGGTRLRRRIEPHVAAPKRREARQSPRERLAGASFLSATETALGHLRLWTRLQVLLDRADMPLRTVEFFYIAVGAGLFLGLATAVGGSSPFVILLAMGFGAGLPLLVVWIKARRRLAEIETQLPDILITIAASLKAGHSFRQGIQAVVDEGQGPASKEFKRVLTETRLGRPMDDALNEMVDRVGSNNLAFVVTAVTIQRQVGGSLAGIFDMVAEAVRSRQQFTRKIKSLTAMGRMSAYVLIGLPFFIAGAITLLNPEYMEPLYHTPAGHKLIATQLVMMFFGSLILKKIVSFKG